MGVRTCPWMWWSTPSLGRRRRFLTVSWTRTTFCHLRGGAARSCRRRLPLASATTPNSRVGVPGAGDHTSAHHTEDELGADRFVRGIFLMTAA
eukprot:2076987-Pyramimonas_sp.AAC.1